MCVEQRCVELNPSRTIGKQLPQALLKAVPTRWSSVYNTISRAYVLWPALEALMAHQEFRKSWRSNHSNAAYPVRAGDKVLLATLEKPLGSIDQLVVQLQSRQILLSSAYVSLHGIVL